MRQNNRQRWAARNRQRARTAPHRTTPTRFPADEVADEALAAKAAALLLGQVLRQLAHGHDAASVLAHFHRFAPRHQQAAIDEHFTIVVDRLIEAGWTPLDLYEVIRRKTTSSASAH